MIALIYTNKQIKYFVTWLSEIFVATKCQLWMLTLKISRFPDQLQGMHMGIYQMHYYSLPPLPSLEHSNNWKYISKAFIEQLNVVKQCLFWQDRTFWSLELPQFIYTVKKCMVYDYINAAKAESVYMWCKCEKGQRSEGRMSNL